MNTKSFILTIVVSLTVSVVMGLTGASMLAGEAKEIVDSVNANTAATQAVYDELMAQR